jgi:hypothetical protein
MGDPLQKLEPPRVRFKDPIDPRTISIDGKIKGYDIKKDVTSVQANVTIGELLHNNPHYRKQLKELTFRRPWKVKLPAVAVKQVGVEDQAALEIDVQIAGCTISKVLVDGGSSVNLMTLFTMSDLGLTKMEKTPKVLKMADQSVVTPVGILLNLETIIGGIGFSLDYYVIDPTTPSSYPILFGRPWLYTAKVHVS